MQDVRSSADNSRPAHGADTVVVTYGCVDHGDPNSHDCVTRRRIAERLAGIMGWEFAGEYDPARTYSARRYFVPSETIIGAQTARGLGIENETDLFGAVVPYAFAATKTITHDTVRNPGFVPQGWSRGFAEDVREAVLEGYAAFTADDVRAAARLLLARGPARIKLAKGIGGVGQFVVRTQADVEAVLAGIIPDELQEQGVVVEQNLTNVTTHSIGQVRVADIVMSYCGTQRLTSNNRGVDVYGGSSLLLARGDFDALLALSHAPEVRTAVAHARTYDAAAHARFPGMFASRRNYDVAQGDDATGTHCSGVLEQSWRIGGASSAEVAALEAFVAAPALDAIKASSVEVFGPCDPPPQHAIVYYRDTDRRAGMLTKYAYVEPYADAR